MDNISNLIEVLTEYLINQNETNQKSNIFTTENIAIFAALLSFGGLLYTVWNHRGWHAGGDANNTHIGFEICEDNLTDRTYFNKVYKEAVELAAYLCKQYKLTEKNIIGHYEGYQKKIASNHGDPRHWFSKHGKSMDTFRADVKKELAKGTSTSKPSTGGKKLYRVQIGAYSVKKNADKQLEKAKKAGFKDAFVKYE